MTEDEVQEALGDLDAAVLLPPKTVAALRLVDLLTVERPAIDADTMAMLREDLDPGEILEFASAIVVGSGWQKMIEAFGVRPDYWNEATPLPWEQK
jgi:alkylhydroperoxidase family enzyme